MGDWKDGGRCDRCGCTRTNRYYLGNPTRDCKLRFVCVGCGAEYGGYQKVVKSFKMEAGKEAGRYTDSPTLMPGT